jgi:hypothetical protein
MKPEIVTVDEAMLFCRIDNEVEVPIVEMLIEAATDAILDYADEWVPSEEVPARIKLAVLCHVARAYDERQDGADMPEAATRLVSPLRRLSI